MNVKMTLQSTDLFYMCHAVLWWSVQFQFNSFISTTDIQKCLYFSFN